MDESRVGVWDVWLTVLTAGVAVAGFLLAAFPSSGPVDILINRYADPVFWPDGSVSLSVAGYRSWIFGVTGATMVDGG